MVCCYNIFKEDTFRKRNDENHKRKPISKSVYDTVSVNIAWLSDAQRDQLSAYAKDFRKGMMDLFNNSKFINSISTGTGQKYNVELRFEQVRNLINQIIEKSDDK